VAYVAQSPKFNPNRVRQRRSRELRQSIPRLGYAGSDLGKLSRTGYRQQEQQPSDCALNRDVHKLRSESQLSKSRPFPERALALKLTQADLIRNFVLMDLAPSDQTRVYEGYWFPMENEFVGANEARFDEFVRHYLTLKTGVIPRIGDIYEAFKEYAFKTSEHGLDRESLVMDLAKYAHWYVNMAMAKEPDAVLRACFIEIEQLRASVVYPLLLRFYVDYSDGVLQRDDFIRLMRDVIAYLFRRTICQIPTNSLNKTFANFANSIVPDNYVESVEARFLTLATYKRFPSNQEFHDSLIRENLYGMYRLPYFFRMMENWGRKEELNTSEYTIEHIMPQNENLDPQWQRDLGENWQEVQERYLHTLGNHLANCPECVNPYRVLTHDGRIAAGFTWLDPNDTTNPIDLLQNEGIRFIDGQADQTQKLNASALLALVDTENQ